MAKWQIREAGAEIWLTLDRNPSDYGRAKQADVVYEDLADGGQCRVMSPTALRRDEFQMVWANVNQDQLDTLMSYINKKVEIKDHLQETTVAYIDAIEKQYLISGGLEQRYAINVKLREV